MNKLVSIIIPNYNREKLIVETLDSILKQTYNNWECIIIDDGSTDNSLEVIQDYIKGDKRFLLIKRPNNIIKGANSCRNIGLKKAIGNYIVFFDSDDIMCSNHLERKTSKIVESDADVVVSKTSWFENPPTILDYDYEKLLHHKITAENFITKKVQWLTPDTIIKSEIAKTIKFDPYNHSAGEYSFFCQLCLKSENIIFLDEILSLRRYHITSNSLIESSEYNKIKKETKEFYDFYNTYKLILPLNPSSNARKFLFDNAMNLIYRNNGIKINKLDFFKLMVTEKGFLSSINFFIKLFF